MSRSEILLNRLIISIYYSVISIHIMFVRQNNVLLTTHDQIQGQTREKIVSFFSWKELLIVSLIKF